VSADERYFKVVLSESQHAALASAAETCEDIWDGTEDEDLAEQEALAAARGALDDAEEIR
jgi:hypothetical protein